jgi:hypothetical protein
MLPPWRSKLAAMDGPSTRLPNVAASPSRIAAIAPGRCESKTTIARTANTSVTPIGRAIGNSPRRERRSQNDQAELDDQQGHQARISDPISQVTKRAAALASGDRDALAAWHGGGVLRHEMWTEITRWRSAGRLRYWQAG